MSSEQTTTHLTLTRRRGEKIVLLIPGEAKPITVQVTEIRHTKGRVKLGIQARRGIGVDRSEIAEAKARKAGGA